MFRESADREVFETASCFQENEMLKPFLIHPSPDKNRFGSKRRRRSSMAQINLPLLAGYADRDFEVRIIDENIEDIDC